MSITHVNKTPNGVQTVPVEVTLHITVDTETSVVYTFDETTGFITEVLAPGVHQRKHTYIAAPVYVTYLNVYETGSPSNTYRMYQYLEAAPGVS